MKFFRVVLQYIVAVLLIGAAFVNIWRFNFSVADLPPRAVNDLILWENRFKSIRQILSQEGYTRGNLAFMTSHSLKGEPPTPEEDVHWVELRYVTIPWILVRGTLDTPFVLGDFGPAADLTGVPENLTKYSDAGNGLILFKRKLDQ